MRQLRLLFLVAICAFGAVILGADATTFALYRNRLGRADGCYTLLDELFRTKAPLDFLRGIELVLAAVLLGIAALSLLRVLRVAVMGFRPRAA